METVRDCIFLGSKIIVDSDCNHEIKRRLLLGRKAMTHLDSILKSRDISLPTKVCLVRAMVFPVVMYGCESWTIKKAECQRIDAFELWCWRRLLRILWTARRSNQSILKEIGPDYSLEGLMLKLKRQYFGPQRSDSLERILMLGNIEDRRRRGWQDEMVGWHHQLGCEFEQVPGVGDGQGSLACCSPWGHKELGMTEWLNCTEPAVLTFRHLLCRKYWYILWTFGFFWAEGPSVCLPTFSSSVVYLSKVPCIVLKYTYASCAYYTSIGASLVAQRLKRLPPMQETWVRSLGWEVPLEKEMVTHSSILTWGIYGQRNLVGYSPRGGKESDTTERLHFHFLSYFYNLIKIIF